MRRYNIVSRIILIPTVIAFALAAPVLVQEKRQACVDVMYVPDMITVLGKRALDEDLNVLWDGLWHYENVWGNRNPVAVHPQELAEMHAPPPSPADTILGSMGSDDESLLESPESGHSHSTHTSLANSDRESMLLDGDAPPTSPELSTESEDWHTLSSSPGWSTESEDWYTPPSSLGSLTDSDSDLDSDSDRWSTISNAPSAESQSKNLKAADSEMRGKRRSRVVFPVPPVVLTQSLCQMELRSAVDPGP
jgi:hypothetical protein